MCTRARQPYSRARAHAYHAHEEGQLSVMEHSKFRSCMLDWAALTGPTHAQEDPDQLYRYWWWVR